MMKQLGSAVVSTPWPILVHGSGFARWGNEAFITRFGINPAGIKRLKVRELLWTLGIQDPLAGIIAAGAVFPELEVATPIEAGGGTMCLRQSSLPEDGMVPADAKDDPLLMLVLSEDQGGRRAVGRKAGGLAR